MFSKKATKIVTIFTVNLTVCSNRPIDGEDFVNFCGLLRKHDIKYVLLIAIMCKYLMRFTITTQDPFSKMLMQEYSFINPVIKQHFK